MPTSRRGPFTALPSNKTWPLVGESDRQAEWRVGGVQPFALHAASGRLYALVNQHGPDAHKSPGREVWIFDVAKRERVQTISLRSPAASFVLVRSSMAPAVS